MRLKRLKSMIVAGIMSGTSADGVDVALCRVSGSGGAPKIQLLHHAAVPYSAAVRRAVLAAMDAESLPVAELARLHWRLGGLYAEAVERGCEEAGLRPELIGCHGQTIYHQGAASRYLGKPVRATWQIGEASVLAERLRVPVVSDFRPADLAAGGQGAPLVPMLDYTLFRSAKVNRVLLNLGGIANLTAIPAGGGPEGVLAFDLGPANMVIDAAMAMLFGKKYDRDGAVARRGRVLPEVVTVLLRHPFFAAAAPKSCGREEFGAGFAADLIARCRGLGGSDADVVATATGLTARGILEAYGRFVWPHLGLAAPLAVTEYVVAGGGARNATLMRLIREGLEPLGVRVRTSEEFGLPGQAKEAVAFALLAWLTWRGVPGNLPAATGAGRGVILGKLTLP